MTEGKQSDLLREPLLRCGVGARTSCWCVKGRQAGWLVGGWVNGWVGCMGAKQWVAPSTHLGAVSGGHYALALLTRQW